MSISSRLKARPLLRLFPTFPTQPTFSIPTISPSLLPSLFSSLCFTTLFLVSLNDPNIQLSDTGVLRVTCRAKGNQPFDKRKQGSLHSTLQVFWDFWCKSASPPQPSSSRNRWHRPLAQAQIFSWDCAAAGKQTNISRAV